MIYMYIIMWRFTFWLLSPCGWIKWQCFILLLPFLFVHILLITVLYCLHFCFSRESNFYVLQETESYVWSGYNSIVLVCLQSWEIHCTLSLNYNPVYDVSWITPQETLSNHTKLFYSWSILMHIKGLSPEFVC